MPLLQATIDMADEVNPPLTYEPCNEDIPVSKIFGSEKPNPENLRKNKIPELVETWLTHFNAALGEIQKKPNDDNLAKLDSLIAGHATWKDHYSLDWNFHQYHGLDKIKATLKSQMPTFELKELLINEKIDPKLDSGTYLQEVHKATDKQPIPVEWVEVVIKGVNKYGTCEGLVRLISVSDAKSPGSLKAFSLYTAMDNIFGNEEQVGERRPRGVNHGQHKGRVSWMDKRKEDFIWGGEKQPTVLIVGGGQGGLNTAARLKVMGIDALIIESNKAIGDNWRNRYKFLVLHDPVWYDHLAYIPFPKTWPIFTPKDKIGDWFESYAKAMELSYWTNKTVSGAEFDDDSGTWTVNIVDNDTKELVKLRPRHVVMATGHSGEPNIPKFKDQELFKGTIVHSSKHTSGKSYQGQNAIVVGCCNSGHDIAQDFYEQGAKPTIVQRSSTCIFRSDVGLKVATGSLYSEGGFKTHIGDLMFYSMDIKLLNLVMQQQARVTAELEKDSRDALKKAGFKLDCGYGGTGLFGKYFRRGGGYYIDVGCSKLIANGSINMKQGVEIDRFTENGVVFTDGSKIDNLAIVVLATGYSNMKETAKRIFGDKVASRLDPVWGLDEEGEIKTMFRDSGHPNFYYMGGNLAISRYFSKKLALRIVAEERGFLKN